MLMDPRFLISASVSSFDSAGAAIRNATAAPATRATSPSRAITTSSRSNGLSASPPARGARGGAAAPRGWPARGRRSHGMAPAVSGMLDDPSEELDDELSGDLRGVVGGHVEHGVDLDEVESDDLAATGDGEQRLAQLVVGQPVDLGRRAARH